MTVASRKVGEQGIVHTHKHALLHIGLLISSITKNKKVPVASRKAGGEGIVHTRTHVKFGSDGTRVYLLKLVQKYKY